MGKIINFTPEERFQFVQKMQAFNRETMNKNNDEFGKEYFVFVNKVKKLNWQVAKKGQSPQSLQRIKKIIQEILVSSFE